MGAGGAKPRTTPDHCKPTGLGGAVLEAGGVLVGDGGAAVRLELSAVGAGVEAAVLVNSRVICVAVALVSDSNGLCAAMRPCRSRLELPAEPDA
jgi:hypothetical protein